MYYTDLEIKKEDLDLIVEKVLKLLKQEKVTYIVAKAVLEDAKTKLEKKVDHTTLDSFN